MAVVLVEVCSRNSKKASDEEPKTLTSRGQKEVVGEDPGVHLQALPTADRVGE